MNSLMKPLNEQYTEYLRDESRTVGQADSISFPVSEAEIISILADLNQSATPADHPGSAHGSGCRRCAFAGTCDESESDESGGWLPPG